MTILTILGSLILGLGFTTFFVVYADKYKSISFVEKYHLDWKKSLWVSLISMGVAIVGFILTTIFGILCGHLDLSLLNAPLTFICGSLSIGFLFAIFFTKYLLDFDVLPSYKKWVQVIFWCSIFLLFFSLTYFMEGIVNYLEYPLNKNVIELSLGSTTIRVAYYAVVIIIGAVFAYYIAVRRLVKLGYRKDIIDSLFYIAFPAGILGARLWYVISQWNSEFAGESFSKVFKIWEGGLAIEGGAVIGALAGVLFLHYRRKEIPTLLALDIIVPGVLLAQAMGRWGNFVNNEVFGMVASRSDWSFLPNWILNQMACNNSISASLEPGQIHVPLFLIEGFFNVMGYFVLRYGVGKLLRKWAVPGDVSIGYLIWYGAVRTFLEPLRDNAYIMDNKISVWMSIAFVVVGVLGIVTMHILHYKGILKRDRYDEILEKGYHPNLENSHV